MAGYKKVILTERRNSLTATTTKDVSNSMSAYDKQLDKFDNNYSSDKLNSIYNEYESIVLNPEKNTLTKTNALVTTKSHEISFKTKVYLSSAMVVIALMVFLAIFNIFVINGMTDSINLVEGNVVVQEETLNDVINEYNRLNNVSEWESILSENGYDVDKAVQVKLKLLDSNNEGDVSLSTNWFDNVCDFISNLFGG